MSPRTLVFAFSLFTLLSGAAFAEAPELEGSAAIADAPAAEGAADVEETAEGASLAEHAGYRTAAFLTSAGGAMVGAGLGLGVSYGVFHVLSQVAPSDADSLVMLGSFATLAGSTIFGAALGGALGAFFFTDLLGATLVGLASGAGAVGGALVGVVPGIALFLSIAAAGIGTGLAAPLFFIAAIFVGGFVMVGGGALGTLAGAGLSSGLTASLVANVE